MQRIDGPYAVSTKPDVSPPATSPGFFSGGDPARGVKATRVTKDWLNWLQEEICNVIEAADIVLDRTDDTQLLQALKALFGLSGSGGNGGGTTTVTMAGYPAEFRNFYERSPLPGWAIRNGALLVAANQTVPHLWAALQKPENAWKCKTQAEWAAMSQAQPWTGIGGAPYFVIDVNAKTIRLPDTRGMYTEDAGFDGLEVGGVHGDAIRNITGQHFFGQDADLRAGAGTVRNPTGAFAYGGIARDSVNNLSWGNSSDNSWYSFLLDVSRVVPTANVNRPRAFGSLPCVYVGGTE